MVEHCFFFLVQLRFRTLYAWFRFATIIVINKTRKLFIGQQTQSQTVQKQTKTTASKIVLNHCPVTSVNLYWLFFFLTYFHLFQNNSGLFFNYFKIIIWIIKICSIFFCHYKYINSWESLSLAHKQHFNFGHILKSLKIQCTYKYFICIGRVV